jgi:magnesium chelatase family protein
MHVTVGAVALRDLSAKDGSERSSAIRARVENARALQRKRYRKMAGVSCNAFAGGRWLDANGDVETDARALLQTAAERLGLSARGYHRVLKVGRTIADLEQSASVRAPHIAEALRYRPISRVVETMPPTATSSKQ